MQVRPTEMSVAAFSMLSGGSPAMQRVRELVRRLAPSEVPILIVGESGVGKEVVARALHECSMRRGRLVGFNAAAVPDGTFESTMFGHVRGAFTGAVADQSGLLTDANGGTLFLDEVAALSDHAQTKLLRALELREFRPLGSRRDVTSEFRLVSATNEPLTERVERNRFRNDLLQRLVGAIIRVPSLVQRRNDIPVIAQSILNLLNAGRGASNAIAIDNSGMKSLSEQSWPGNVRELRQVLTTARALAQGATIQAVHVEEAIALRDALDKDVVQSSERADIRAMLDAHNGDVQAAASAMGIHRATLYRKLRRLGIR